MTAVSDETGRNRKRDAYIGVLASLAAAISLLENTPRSKKAAASDKMFDQMVADYKKALDEGRAALSASPVAQEPVAWQLRQCPRVFWTSWRRCSREDYELVQKTGVFGDAPAQSRQLFPSSPPATPAGVEEDWRDDPSADERWQAGLAYGMERFCSMLGVDPKDVRWDAATEELDGDVCAVIGNILRVKFGDDFDPMKPLPPAGLEADEIARHGIYIASKMKHADRWRFLRDKVGEPIISTWIDEAGEGESSDLHDLWRRCLTEASSCQVLIAYREKDEVLKGGWVEIGAALSSGIPVYAVGLEEFTIAKYRGITHFPDMKSAIAASRTILALLSRQTPDKS